MNYKDNEQFSNEFKTFLGFIENTLSKELPTPVISMEYFVLGFLEKQDSFAYKVLNIYLTTHAINTIHETYFEMLNKKAISIVKPNRELKFDEKAQTLIDCAIKEAEKTPNGEKVTTIHLLLAFLNDYLPNNSVKKVFNHAGVDYNCILSKKEGFTLSTNTEVSSGNTQETKNNSPFQLSNILPMTGGRIEVIGVDNINSITELLSGVGGGGSKPNKKTSIDTYCFNISQMAKDKKIDDIINRDNELNEIVKTLSRRKKNNVIVIGESGVGKTSLVYGLAYLIEKQKVPMSLRNKRIMQLNPTSLVGGTQWRGMLEERLNLLVSELKKDRNTILFIDDIAQVFSEKSSIEKDSGNIWGNLLDTGDVQIIATSDFKGHKKVMDANPTFNRRFQKLVLESPSIEKTIEMLTSVKQEYERFHKVKYTDEAIKTCVVLAEKYLTEKKLPDSAIDVLDEVGAFLHVKATTSEELEKLYADKISLENEINMLKRTDQFAKADEKDKELQDNIVKINEIEAALKKELRLHPITVTVDDILENFSRSTNIPVTQLNSTDKHVLNDLNNMLKTDVIGQDEAIDKICSAIKRNRIGLSKTATYGNFLLIGSTGVGKTFLAKKLAKLLFGDENKMVRFDLSEYNDKTASNKLIGANAGYVGYENGGLLTEAIKNKKHCVLLLDEIEKADKEIFNLFLQVFDEGFLTDNTGNKVDFKNVIILATSNVGTKNAAVFGKGIGFNNDEEKNKKNILNKELKKKFAPEFLNRFNDIIYFNSLSDDNLRTIITNNIEEYKRILLEKHDIRLTYFNCTIEYILKVIEEEKEFGARPIARAIEREIIDKISDAILTTDEKIGECIFTVDENGELRMRKIEASVWCGSETKILDNLYEKED